MTDKVLVCALNTHKIVICAHKTHKFCFVRIIVASVVFRALKTAFFEQGKQPEIIRTYFDITSTKKYVFSKN